MVVFLNLVNLLSLVISTFYCISSSFKLFLCIKLNWKGEMFYFMICYEDKRWLQHQPTFISCCNPFSVLLLTSDPPEWVPDEACNSCIACEAPFTVIRRKHHCRSCGKVQQSNLAIDCSNSELVNLQISNYFIWIYFFKWAK